jgi:hypothetical protein
MLRIVKGLWAFLLAGASLYSQAPSPVHGKRYPRLAIRNAMIVDGNGTPASGPKDIAIENERIVAVVPFDPVSSQGGPPQTPAGRC